MSTILNLQWAALTAFAYVAVLGALVVRTSRDWTAGGYGRGRFNVRRDVYGRTWFALTSKSNRASVIVLRMVAIGLLIASFALQVAGSRGN